MAGIYINIEGPGKATDASRAVSRPGIAYAHALCKELNFYAPTHSPNETIEAIHFGGAPFHIREEGIRAVVGTLFSCFDALHVNEFSIDLSPLQLDMDTLEGLAALGFDTVNIQAGSLFEADLEKLGHTFNPELVATGIENCRHAGMRTVSLTFNIDIADQPIEYWAASFEKARSYGVNHIEILGMPIYNVEGNAPQLAACFSYPDTEENAQVRYRFAQQYLAEAGFEHYVLSAFAAPGHQSKMRELQLYHGNILGIGPRAHSFWWMSGSRSQANRWANVDNIAYYGALLEQKELPVESRSRLDLDTLANEYVFLRLQHAEGLDLLRLESAYGLDLLSDHIEELAWLESEGIIEPIRNNRVRLSEEGKAQSQAAFTRLLF
ncbi:MAG: coproporphyrinogen III oxidase family protein [Bacteroidota bacterium]